MKRKLAVLYPLAGMEGVYLSPQDNAHLLRKTNAVKSVRPHKKTRSLLRIAGVFNHELGR
jgi:hypothetical protein